MRELDSVNIDWVSLAAADHAAVAGEPFLFGDGQYISTFLLLPWRLGRVIM